MTIPEALDVLNTCLDFNRWQGASDFLKVHGVGWSFSWTHRRFLLVDLSTQRANALPDDYQVEPIGPVEQLCFGWVASEVG